MPKTQTKEPVHQLGETKNSETSAGLRQNSLGCIGMLRITNQWIGSECRQDKARYSSIQYLIFEIHITQLKKSFGAGAENATLSAFSDGSSGSSPSPSSKLASFPTSASGFAAPTSTFDCRLGLAVSFSIAAKDCGLHSFQLDSFSATAAPICLSFSVAVSEVQDFLRSTTT